MDKIKKVSLLFDYYGQLLTKRQQNIIKLYYYHDLSLGEISDKEDISRQAVYDHLQRSEKILLNYEEKLNLCRLFSTLKDNFNNLMEYISQNPEINKKEKNILLEKLQDIKTLI